MVWVRQIREVKFIIIIIIIIIIIANIIYQWVTGISFWR
jgi:hypothetical protein